MEHLPKKCTVISSQEGEELSIDDFFKDSDTRFVVTAALRYCRGRMTYAPGLVTGWVKEYWKYFPQDERDFIIKETKEYMESNLPKGDKCDICTWEDFYQWIQDNQYCEN